MKRVLLLLVIALTAACCVNDATTPSKHIRMDCNNDNLAERGKLIEFVTGEFNGDEQSEYAALYCFDGGSEDDCENGMQIYCCIRFGNSDIPALYPAWVTSNLTNEGDLNGDGTDEIGFLVREGPSYWGEYRVYTSDADSWRELVSVSHHEDWNPAPYQELVRANPDDAGSLIIKSTDFAEDGVEVNEITVEINR
jgi:hypothetical protein